jgi:putative transposase
MDGKGAWRDNVFVERLWRSVKYEEVYLRAYETVGGRATRSADISTFIIGVAPIRVLTAARRIKPTSPRCRSVRQPNPDRRSTYRRGDSVQTTGTSSQRPRTNGPTYSSVCDLPGFQLTLSKIPMAGSGT